MYKLVVVDDENDVRCRLVELIGRSTDRFEIVGNYCNGADAYDGIVNDCPDVVITDIKIPFLDGLSLVQRIKPLLPLTKVVFITGFDEFDYAKQAANLNISGFFSKPINGEEISVLLNKLAGELDEEFLKVKNIQRLERFYSAELPVIREKDFKRLLTLSSFSDSFKKKLATDKINLDFKNMFLAFFDFDEMRNDLDDEQREYALTEIRDDMQQLMTEYASDVFNYKDGLVAIIKSNSDLNMLRCETVFKHIAMRIKRVFDLDMSVGVSTTSARSFKDMIEECENALRLRGIVHKAYSGVYFSDNKAINYNEPDKAIDYKELVRLMRCNMGEEFTKKLTSLKELALQISLNSAYVLVTNILNTVIDGCVKKEDLHKKCGTYSVILKQIIESKTLESAFKIVFGIAKEVLELNSHELNNSVDKDFERLCLLVEENYTVEEFGLEKLAEMVCMSVSSVSLIFKRGDTTFVKYLNALRMDKAKELLLIEDNKIIWVANKLGFSDPYYFSHCFKKIVGVSPKEYKLGKKSL